MLVEMRQHLCPQAELLAGLGALLDPEQGISFQESATRISSPNANLRKGDEDDAVKVMPSARRTRAALPTARSRDHLVHRHARRRLRPVANAGSIFHFQPVR